MQHLQARGITLLRLACKHYGRHGSPHAACRLRALCAQLLDVRWPRRERLQHLDAMSICNDNKLPEIHAEPRLQPLAHVLDCAALEEAPARGPERMCTGDELHEGRDLTRPCTLPPHLQPRC